MMKKRVMIYGLFILNIIFLAGNLIFYAAMKRDGKEDAPPASENELMMASQTEDPAVVAGGVSLAEGTARDEDFVLPTGNLPEGAIRQYLYSDPYSRKQELQEDNPVDAQFAPYWGKHETTIEERGMASHYRECWEKEAMHALELLGNNRYPQVDSFQGSIQELRVALQAFAVLDGELYADMFVAGEIPDADGKTRLHGGSIWPAVVQIVQASHYRAYTIYVYDILATMGMEPDFVISGEEIKGAWGYLIENEAKR